MGGRGASSGKYKWRGQWHTYGDEYHSVYQYRNIKFIKINEGSATAPMETMTNGRVYVLIKPDNTLKSITYYKGNGTRRKQIDLDHYHKIDGKPEKPHRHLGYTHTAEGGKLTAKEQKILDKANRLWHDFISR